MLDQPRVSIIIPVFNGANYLKTAIESALKQSYKNCEVIVVNDGSNDDNETENIALSFGNMIRYIKKENGGVASALNVGIKHMSGEYFSWLSHDDLYYPNKIERQIQEIRKRKRLTDIVYCNYDSLDTTVNKISTGVIIGKADTNMEDGIYPVLYRVIHGCTLLIHKSHFDRVGIFDETLITTQDYDLWFKMFRNQKLIYMQDSLCLMRYHNAQGSKTISCHFKEEAALNIKIMNELTDREVKKYYGDEYNFYYQFLIFCRRKSMDEYNYILGKFKKLDMPPNTCNKIDKLKLYINQLSNGQAKKMCIFGAGQYGSYLYYELKHRTLEADFFSDNNIGKWGKHICGIPCVAPDKIDKQNTLIIVSIKYPDIVMKQLKDEGFKYVVSKQDLDSIINDTPPLKWLILEEDLTQIDYASPEVMDIINKYNKIIFDICQYYESKEGKEIECTTGKQY